jgi:predicted RNA-binding Zn ribbon-like protein
VDFASYAQWAVELGNSFATGADGGFDALADLASLQAFLTDAGHAEWSEQAGTDERNGFVALREARDALRAVFVAAQAGDHESATAGLNHLLAAHAVRPCLVSHGEQWHLHLTPAGAGWRWVDEYVGGAAFGLAVLVADDGLDRLGVCRAPRCADIYVDVSTNRSRRYCSDGCANRANVAAFRARLRAGR